MILRKLFKIFKITIEFIFNINKKYFDKKTSALDEVIKDYKDFELAGWIEDTFPLEFEYKPDEIFNQAKDWYRYSCTSQWTCWSSNVSRKYKADKTKVSPFELWDEMKKRWLGKEWLWAYLIDTIKTWKELNFINWYYRVSNNNQIKKAIYNVDLVVTWSWKINWKQLKLDKYIVKSKSVWEWHAFYLIWWNKVWFIAMNSYWEKYWLWWTFIIPYDIFWDIAFVSTYAIVVNPEWTKLSREELYKKYLIKTK